VRPRAAIEWRSDFLDCAPLFGTLRSQAGRLDLGAWPSAADLDRLAGGRLVSGSGARLRFVQAGEQGRNDLPYERRVFELGEVACRPENWHDLFNALVWLTFPRTKAAINARHVREMASEPSGKRGRARDALTLFDEGGLIVASADPAMTRLIREFRWKELFWARRAQLARDMLFLVFGHALYEKALAPFVGITASALLLDVDATFLSAGLDAQLAAVDARAAATLSAPDIVRIPTDFSPVPVLGVPGWSPRNEDERFYDDAGYFRAGRGGQSARAR
jgi:hypothetical protein